MTIKASLPQIPPASTHVKLLESVEPPLYDAKPLIELGEGPENSKEQAEEGREGKAARR